MGWSEDHRRQFTGPVDAVDPDEFRVAFALMNGAFGGEVEPFNRPSELKLAIDNEDGTVDRLQLRDDEPLNRGSMALLSRYDGSPQFIAVMTRFFATMDLITTDERTNRYQRPCESDSEAVEISEVVLEVGATMPLHGMKGFDADEFFARVEALWKEDAESDAADD